jgi:hypothetical protein
MTVFSFENYIVLLNVKFCPYCKEIIQDCELLEALNNISTNNITQVFNFHIKHIDEETTIPEGFRKGYPSEIDWNDIRVRVKAMKVELENVLVNRRNSVFLKECTSSRSTMCLAGYYGPKGITVIGSVVQDMFRTLNPKFVRPYTVSSFIFDILTPEAIIRLIRADFNVDNKKAAELMRDSQRFGDAVHNIETNV